MDIRDIKEKAVYPDGCGLEEIFKLQKVLIDHYVGIEGLPPYPIDINTRSSQDLIKDFAGRVIEELGEAWESYEIMMEMKDQLVSEDKHLLIPHLQNFNEEVSDAIHFWAELLILTGLDKKALSTWILELPFAGKYNDDLLNGFLIWGGNTLDFRFQKVYPSFKVISNQDLKDPFLKGGRSLGFEIMSVMKQLLWDATYQLQIARNTLKNKPWKQTEMMTDESLFETKIKDATRSMFQFFYFAGFDKNALFTIYFKKNLVNQFRIRSKY